MMSLSDIYTDGNDNTDNTGSNDGCIRHMVIAATALTLLALTRLMVLTTLITLEAVLASVDIY